MTTRARRIDAQRNLDAILEAARTTLPWQPDASMQEIAASAGVHRATVHRHFAAREDLLTALRGRAVDESLLAVKEAATGSLRAADALENVSAAVLATAERYRLFRFTNWRDDVTVERGREIGEIVVGLLDRGRADNEVRTDLDSDELLLVWNGLIEALGPQVSEAGLTREDAARLVRRVLAAPH